MLQLETFPSDIFLTPAVKLQNYYKHEPPSPTATADAWCPTVTTALTSGPSVYKTINCWRRKTHSSCQLTCRSLEFSGPQKNLWPSNWKPAVVLYASESQTHVTLALLRTQHTATHSNDNRSSRLWRRRWWFEGSTFRWDHHQRIITITITGHRMNCVRFTHNIFSH